MEYIIEPFLVLSRAEDGRSAGDEFQCGQFMCSTARCELGMTAAASGSVAVHTAASCSVAVHTAVLFVS
jgi:hypothetical protein